MPRVDEFAFVPLTRAHLPLISRWLAAPHVARWWREDPSPAAVAATYGPAADGEDTTEVFVVERGGAPIGLIQRMSLADEPEWLHALVPGGARDGDASIDYLIGEEQLIGRGTGTVMIAAFVARLWARYPRASQVVVGVQQENVASWRALEHVGFTRTYAGMIESDDPSDEGPTFIYVLPRPAPMIRVLLVDDHEMVAESLRRVLDIEDDITVVAVAASMASATDAARAHQPDVVLMDYSLPDGDGVRATEAVRAEVPGTKVIMLTGGSTPAALAAAFEVGCVGYLEKTAGLAELPHAVRTAAAGGYVLSPEDAARLARERSPLAGPAALSPREQEVLELIADGLSNAAMAERLHLSVNTVRTHVQTLLAKLGAHSKLEAAAIARQRGLLRD